MPDLVRGGRKAWFRVMVCEEGRSGISICIAGPSNVDAPASSARATD
jgi:hypothetical protein